MALSKNSKNLPPYDIVIDIHGSIKSAIFAKCIPIKDGAKSLIGFSKQSIKEGIASKLYDKTFDVEYLQNIYMRNVELIAKALNIPINKKDHITHKAPYLFYNEDRLSEYIKTLIAQKEPQLLVVIGASVANKIYPIDKMAKVVNELQRPTVVLWGSPSEQAQAMQLSELSDFITVSDRLSFNDIIYLIQNIKLVIGNDTGITHFAFALNKPSLTLFGNTSADIVVFETSDNKAIESDTPVNHWKINHKDFSIQDIEAIRDYSHSKEPTEQLEPKVKI